MWWKQSGKVTVKNDAVRRGSGGGECEPLASGAEQGPSPRAAWLGSSGKPVLTVSCIRIWGGGGSWGCQVSKSPSHPNEDGYIGRLKAELRASELAEDKDAYGLALPSLMT